MESRPYLRSSLARSVYQKMLVDQNLKSLDKSKWYSCDSSLLLPEVADLFVLSRSDEETEDFLENCFQKSDWIFMQIYHAVAKALLCWFMSKTSINGYLGRGSMFVFSKCQFATLLASSRLLSDSSKSLLDLGAGDGKVTDVISADFSQVYVTEISSVMKNILQAKKYNVLEVSDWWKDGIGLDHYDLITCLNLLDRCDTPLTILQQMYRKLKPNSGLLIVALVLPLQQYVETNPNKHIPSEKINVEGSSFEEQVSHLSVRFFPENGFQVQRWTRLPYLCEGDMHQSFYWLNDAVFVLKPIDHFGQSDSSLC